MARKREKKVVLSGITAAQMEEAMAAYASADAETAKINAAMDVQFTAIREKYSTRLTELAARKQQAFDTVQAYATENRDTLFAKRRSLDNSHGTFGFRTGTPKLKTRRGFTWAAVLELLRGTAPSYIRTSEDVAKDRLLADRDTPEVAALMPRIGVEVVQDETFFIELKKEETEAV